MEHELQHTPGEWTADWVSDTVFDINVEHYPLPIAKVAGAMNALLMAAAPGLLAALEAVEWVQAGGSRNDVMYCPWCNGEDHAPDCQRQAALKAARGDA